MLNLQEYRQHVQDMEQRLKELQDKSASYAETAQDTEAYLEYLKGLQPHIEKGTPYFMPEDNSHQSTNGNGTHQSASNKGKGAINNRLLYQRIILYHGQPMHVRDIVKEAISCGLEFQTPNPNGQVRNSLNNAKKMFYNTGSNTWWIVGEPEPGQEEAQTVQ